MMENEIEKMAEVILAGWNRERPCEDKAGFRDSILTMMKEEDLRYLVEAGYRKTDEVKKEVAKEILDRLLGFSDLDEQIRAMAEEFGITLKDFISKNPETNRGKFSVCETCECNFCKIEGTCACNAGLAPCAVFCTSGNYYHHVEVKNGRCPDYEPADYYKELQKNVSCEPMIRCPSCNKEDWLTAWKFVHDDQGKGYLCPICGERFTWNEVMEYNQEEH